MDRRSARLILVAALITGLSAQALFYRTALGINLILFQGAVLAAAVLLARSEARIDRADLWIPPAALLFAGFPAIRADPAVVAFDVLAAAGLGAAAVAAIGGAALTRRSLAGLLAVAGHGLALVAGGALEPARERGVVDSVLRTHAQALRQPEVTGWPAWNLAREQARAALAAHLGP